MQAEKDRKGYKARATHRKPSAPTALTTGPAQYPRTL